MPDLNDNYKAENTNDKTAEEKHKEKQDDESDENRPSGTRTAKDSTGINVEAEKPIKEKMPSMPPA